MAPNSSVSYPLHHLPVLLHCQLLGVAYCLRWTDCATGSAASPVAMLQLLWLRNSTTEPANILQLRYCARQFVSPGPCRPLGYERNHSHITPQFLLQPGQVF